MEGLGHKRGKSMSNDRWTIRIRPIEKEHDKLHTYFCRKNRMYNKRDLFTFKSLDR